MDMGKAFLILYVILFSQNGLYAQKLIDTGGLGYSQTSVNTTIFRTNSLITHNNTQYIAFYNGEGYMVLGKRLLNSDEWTLSLTQYRGNVRDAHNVISMMVDGDGYLHVAFDHHDNRLNYCRSVKPGSLVLGEKEPMIGNNEESVTYPEFYRLSNGDLLFAYRSGASGRGNLVLNRYEVKTRKWYRVQDVLVDGEGQRNAYWQIFLDSKGTIHLSWVWRETWDVSTNHDLCYARSRDGGVTWERSDGEKYQLPINITNAEYAWRIPQNSELINQTSISADNKGNPYIATYWKEPESDIPQYRIVWFDGKSWHHQQVSERKMPFSLSGGGTKMIPISRPQLAIQEKRGKSIIYYLFRDEERGSKVSLAKKVFPEESDWKVADLTDFPVDAWEPTYDSELWKKQQKLHIYVQRSGQGDGEGTTDLIPQPVYVLEYK